MTSWNCNYQIKKRATHNHTKQTHFTKIFKAPAPKKAKLLWDLGYNQPYTEISSFFQMRVAGIQMLDLVNYSFAVFPSLRHSSSHDNALQTAQTGLNEPNELTHKPQTCAYFYLTHMVALGNILTINHRRDRKGKREGDRWAESMLPVCLQAWLLTSTEMKEQGSLLDMLGFPTVHSPEMRYKLIGIHCMFWGQVLIAAAVRMPPKNMNQGVWATTQSVSADGY